MLEQAINLGNWRNGGKFNMLDSKEQMTELKRKAALAEQFYKELNKEN